MNKLIIIEILLPLISGLILFFGTINKEIKYKKLIIVVALIMIFFSIFKTILNNKKSYSNKKSIINKIETISKDDSLEIVRIYKNSIHYRDIKNEKQRYLHDLYIKCLFECFRAKNISIDDIRRKKSVHEICPECIYVADDIIDSFERNDIKYKDSR